MTLRRLSHFSRSRAALVALSFLTGACLSIPERRVVDQWLYCEECLTTMPAQEPSELRAVERLHWRAVSLLSHTLLGPTPRQRGALDSMLARDYYLIREYRAMGLSPAGIRIDSAQFVSRYDEGMVAALQKRAALALWQIGTPSARAAIRYALKRDVLRTTPLRPDVRLLLDTLNARRSP